MIKEDIIHFLLFAIPKQTYDFKVQKGQERIAITGGACGSFSHHESKVLETGESSDCTAVQCKTLLMKMATSHVWLKYEANRPLLLPVRFLTRVIWRKNCLPISARKFGRGTRTPSGYSQQPCAVEITFNSVFIMGVGKHCKGESKPPYSWLAVRVS